MPAAQGQVGVQKNSDGTVPTQGYRQGQQGDILVSELHGKFFEQTRAGVVYSTGMTLTAINNATFTTLTATTTPIVGIWNPPTSLVNLVPIQAMLSIALTAATSTGGAPFVWAYSTGNNAISTGLTPVNRRTLTAAGSLAKGFANTALTGLTNNLVIAGASGLGGGSAGAFSQVGTAVGFSPSHYSTIEVLEGAWVIPPGGVLALLATTTPVAHSAASMLVWEEVPI